MGDMDTDVGKPERVFHKKPKAYGLELFWYMLSGEMKLPAKGRKYVFYMYLALFGSCTREMVPLLLDAAERAVPDTAFMAGHTYKSKNTGSKAVDDFISYRLRKGSIIRTVIRGRILYSLSPAGYKELSGFMSSPYAGHCMEGWHPENISRTVKNHSVHSATAGIAFLYMAGRCRIGIGDFALNTPIDPHGGIRGKTFDQSPNRLRSDARLLISSPCRLEIFFENDMGTERVDAVGAKMERYFALIFSAERSLDSSCVHFTIGDYHERALKQDIKIPGKNKLQLYRSCVSVLLSAVNMTGGGCTSEAGNVMALLDRASGACSMAENDILHEIMEYLSYVRETCPAFTDIYSYFDRTRVMKAASAGENILLGADRKDTRRAYLTRREKIFTWCRDAPDISMLVKRGFRITASDNCSDGTDFVHAYPALAAASIMAYEKTVREHILSYSYRGKYTDIGGRPSDVQAYPDAAAAYANIRFFQAGGTFYPFANCCVLHDVKGSFTYSFEDISDDISARMRIEKYLDDGAPDIPFLRLHIVYSGDRYSLEYAEFLRAEYGHILDSREDISLLGI